MWHASCGERIEAEASTMADKHTIKLLRGALSWVLARVFYDQIHVVSNRAEENMFRNVSENDDGF